MTECVAKGIEHKYTFMKDENGQSLWFCILCNDFYYQFEDSQP